MLDLPPFVPLAEYRHLGDPFPDVTGGDGPYLAVLSIPVQALGSARCLGWMQFARCGFALSAHPLFRLGSGRLAASAAGRRQPSTGGILSDGQSPAARLGICFARPRDVG